MSQPTQTERKVRFNITPQQAASKTSKRPGFKKKFSTLVEKEHLEERADNTHRRLQQLLHDKQQFCKWADAYKNRTCTLEEQLVSQGRYIKLLEEKLGPQSQNIKHLLSEASSQAAAPTWANVVSATAALPVIPRQPKVLIQTQTAAVKTDIVVKSKAKTKTKQLANYKELQASGTPAPTKVDEAQAEPLPLFQILQGLQQGSSPTPNMIWAHDLESENEIREQLRQREAEVLQFKQENEGLVGMLREAQNFQIDPAEVEALQNQVVFLETKTQTLQEENKKLQEANQALVEKTQQLENIHLTEQENIPMRELNSQLKNDIERLQKEQTKLEGHYNFRFHKMKYLENLLFQETQKNKDLAESVHHMKQQITRNDGEFQRLTELLSQESNRKQEMVKHVKNLEQQIIVRDQEVQRLTGISQSLSESLFNAEELLLDAGNELEAKEQTWKTDRDDLRGTITLLQQNNQELQELSETKKHKKSFFSLFKRSKVEKNEKATEEVIEENNEQPEQEEAETEKKEKKGCWSWFRSSRKVKEAAPPSSIS